MDKILRTGAIVSLTALSLVGCAAETEPEETVTVPTEVETPQAKTPVEPTDLGEPEVIAENLDAPWSIVFVDETPVISERDTGRIVELDENGTTRELATVEQTMSPGEGGLLGIAVHRSEERRVGKERRCRGSRRT